MRDGLEFCGNRGGARGFQWLFGRVQGDNWPLLTGAMLWSGDDMDRMFLSGWMGNAGKDGSEVKKVTG